jgi:aminopeptidase N
MSHPAFLFLTLAPLAAAAVSPGRGISETLATDRAAAIRALRYELSFRIPDAKSDPLRGFETVRFELAAPREITLDFDQPRDRILSVDAPFEFVDGHILIPASATKAGANALHIEFLAGDESLNRNDEFLYTLFVPARAHFAFPCFDQPSLKARYSLKLDVPAAWAAVANGAETNRFAAGPRAIVSFAETEPLPTYLFAFAAGRFQIETAVRNGRTFRMFHRETDAAKVARNRDAIFDLHARAVAWLEDYTAIPYPWGKFDFVLIPSFQFGGMEHAGAILYNASGLMLDASATQNQLLGRASVIAHETAHMWFGDLVTMRWFNDVWMKEVMANFMAAKIVNPSFPEINHELRFLLAHYPAAYEVDRTAGANPIRQPLANLDEAGSLYGAIIYEKAPIVMRQLETIMGERGYRDGMRDYLEKYSFGNATWLDLVAILEARKPGQVAKWSHAWVEERGRPEITTSGATLTQHDPLGRGLVWPQRLQVTVGYKDRVEQHEVALNGATAAIPLGKERPLYVLPNGGGIGYGLFRLDAASLAYLTAHIEEIPDALTRGAAWIDLWENLLDHRITPAAFLDTAGRAVVRETDEQNTQRVLSYLVRDFWHGIPAADRTVRAPALEALFRRGLAAARTSSQKSAWFNAFRDTALTSDGLAWLERVWHRDEKIEGLTFAEADEIEMALNLAVRDVPKSEEILKAQLARTQNPDRKARFAFVMPALSADPAVRDRLFESFRDPANRRHEPWVLEAERFLNHPLRSPESRKYVRPALDLLPEIQRTGDIFFPKRWADATLNGHRSKESAAAVRAYLAAHPELPQRMKWVVLSSADELFRAVETRKEPGPLGHE